MNRSFRRSLLLIGLATTLGFISALLLRPQTSSRGSEPFGTRIYRAIRNPRRAYARWRVERETSMVEALIRDADVSLEADSRGFTCNKPLAPDGRPIRIPAKDIAASSILPRPDARRAVVIRIPSEWPLQQTTNASRTEMEDLALDAAIKAKACGFHRITVYQRAYGMCLRVFDGEAPSRQAIDATVRRQMAMLSGL